jgi:hypothetical protein
MAVHVDDFEVDATVNGLRRRWTHLFAYSHEELVQFGRRARLSTAWLQKRGTARQHFDVTSAVRRRAIALGAIPVDYLGMQAILQRKASLMAGLPSEASDTLARSGRWEGLDDLQDVEAVRIQETGSHPSVAAAGPTGAPAVADEEQLLVAR